MVTTSDLLPFASGSASIGVNQIGTAGFGNPVPYNHIHFVSGVIHDPILGVSGIIRFAKNLGDVSSDIPQGIFRGFELSADGGNTFGLRIGSTKDTLNNGVHAIVSGPGDLDSNLYLLSSGNFECHSQSEIKLISIDSIRLNALSLVNVTGQGILVSAGALAGIELESERDIDLEANGFDSIGGQITLRAFASSGRLQYRFGPHQGWAAKLTHSNTGGPANDGFWPLPHSGQIAQMIAQATPGGSVDLQTAYDNGNEIDHVRDVIGYKGVVIRETSPGFNPTINNQANLVSKKATHYGIAVSGFTLTPSDLNTFSLASLNSSSLIIHSSGTSTSPTRAFFLGYLVADPSTAIFFANSSLRFLCGDTTGTGLGGQIAFDPFNGSGSLTFRMGPHQGWAAKLTHSSIGGPNNDGFWPIPHSGQVLETIARTPKSKAITIERPAVNNDLTIWYTNEPIFITEVESILRGGFDASGEFAIRHSTDRSQVGTSITTLPITCTNRTTGQITTSFVSQSIPADSWLWIGVSGVSGVATSQLSVTIQYLN